LERDLIFLGLAISVSYFFFFQAEDGIRDYKVTGVQTCALPIFLVAATATLAAQAPKPAARPAAPAAPRAAAVAPAAGARGLLNRSEERRVGKECRSRWSR